MSTPYFELFKEVLTGGVYDESAWMMACDEPRPTDWWARVRWRLKRALAQRLERRRFALVRVLPFDRKARDTGGDWPLVGYTMTGRRRLDQLQSCIETVLAEGIPGDVAETGVWRGGSCMLVKALFDAHGVRDRTVWLADSFQGLPPPKDAGDGGDLSWVKHLAVSADQVRANFARFGLLDDRVKLLEGWFADTLPTAPIGRLAVLRLDGDLYHSTMDSLTHLYHRVVPGGFVIVDDYLSWPGCRRAVDEFLAARGLQPKIEPIDWTAVWWRVPAAEKV